MESETVSKLLDDAIYNSCTPKYRQPGGWVQQNIISSDEAFSQIWPSIYQQMGAFKFVGLDVESADFGNERTFAQLHFNDQGWCMTFIRLSNLITFTVHF